jgi:hypothetical protein
MRTGTPFMPAAVGALALAVVLTGCNGSGSDKGQDDSGSPASAGKASADITYRLGEASPPQESTMQRSQGSTFTVTPTKVQTGTKAEVDDSGLQLDKRDGPQVPVYVWATLTHKSGKPMPVATWMTTLS